MPKVDDRTVRERLKDEFACAITAIYGDLADKSQTEVEITKEDLKAILKKVEWYIYG